MFGKKNQGPDARAQMRKQSPKVEAKVDALETRREYMERILTHWIQNSERYKTMPDFIPKINAFLKRISEARSMEDLDVINSEFSVFAQEASSFDSK